MSEQAGPCGYCGKTVRNKWLVGYLHICLTVEERAMMDYGRDLWWRQQMSLRSKPLSPLDISGFGR